jgi:hypothetical protein
MVLRNLVSKSFAVACALLIAGCAHHERREHLGRAPDPAFPQVLIGANGGLVVNQEPVVIARKRGETAVVTWQVPEASGVTFNPETGITFDALIKILAEDPSKPPIKLERPRPVDGNQFACSTAKNRLEVVCRIAPEVPAGVYSYTINAIRDGKPVVLDPTGWIEKPR